MDDLVGFVVPVPWYIFFRNRIDVPYKTSHTFLLRGATLHNTEMYSSYIFYGPPKKRGAVIWRTYAETNPYTKMYVSGRVGDLR